MLKLMTVSFLSLLLSLNTFANSNIAIVDADMIIQKSDKGKEFFAQMEEFSQSKREAIQKKVEDFRSKQKDVQAKAASMSEDKKSEALVNLQNMENEIKRMQEDAEREHKMKLNEGLERFQKELGPLIRQVAIEKGFDAVFNYGASSGLVYFSESIDITDLVIQRYNATQ